MSAESTHKDHIPNSKKEKMGTLIFLISITVFFCIVFIYVFAYAIPESKAEKQKVQQVETQQREYLDDKFENSIFNMMYRGVLNEKNNIIQVLYPYQQTFINDENSDEKNNNFTIAMSESYLVENSDKEDEADLLCTHVRIEADKDLVHLTNDNFAYIVDNDDSNKNFFDNGNEGEVNEDRKQFPVSLEGTPVDVDKFDRNGISDTSVTVHPHQKVEFSLCMQLLTSPKTDTLKDDDYHWAVLNNDKESLAQWDVSVSDFLKVDKARKF